ncbi:MAG TPA: hypothetical protein VK249_25875 [Anaerolineales bacterium]|nr:hypothetical protein [Anaerolineales bacterium]
MPKPSDFFVDVLEFFTILLPGACLIYLIQPLIINNTPALWLPANETQGWIVFLVLAYIAGHLLHAIGSWILDDYVYNKFYVPRWRASHSQAVKWINGGDSTSLRKDKDAVNTLLARVYLTTKVNTQGTNYYDWCLSAVRMNSPAGTVEVDRLQADSKFFRSMVLIFLVTALLSLQYGLMWLSIGFAALTIFATWRFCELRWTATKRVYEYYLLLQPTTKESVTLSDNA